MRIKLTDSDSGNPMYVDSDSIRLIEAHSSGAHIVFDEGMGRVVNEPADQIAALVGFSVPGEAAISNLKKK